MKRAANSPREMRLSTGKGAGAEPHFYFLWPLLSKTLCCGRHRTYFYTKLKPWNEHMQEE